MKYTPLFPLLVLCSLSACRNETTGMEKLDLAPHGLPVTILAPDSASVQVKDYTVMRDFTVRKGDDYFVQIFEFNVPVLDAAGEKLRQLDAVREDPFFTELIQDDEHGFIFSKQHDSAKLDYDFRLVKIIGEKELIFQTGLVGSFSLDEVRRMYKAVK